VLSFADTEESQTSPDGVKEDGKILETRVRPLDNIIGETEDVGRL
jgi:hypothetical protein